LAVEILFKFSSTILCKFKEVGGTLCINFSHKKKLIDTKNHLFSWLESISTKIFFFYHQNLITFSLISYTKNQKVMKIKFEIKIEFHKFLGTKSL
jgi:hypothetical protein